MPSATQRFKDEPFESLFKRWKRAVEKDGLIQELRCREFYEKPSSIKKRAKAAAIKRMQRTLAQNDTTQKRARRAPSKSPTKTDEKKYRKSY